MCPVTVFRNSGPVGLPPGSSHSQGPDPKTRLVPRTLVQDQGQGSLAKSTAAISCHPLGQDRPSLSFPLHLYSPNCTSHHFWETQRLPVHLTPPSPQERPLQSGGLPDITGHCHRTSQHSASSSNAWRLLSAQNLLCSGGFLPKRCGVTCCFLHPSVSFVLLGQVSCVSFSGATNIP